MGFRVELSCRSLAHLGLAVLTLGTAANRVGAQPSAPVELAGVPQRINNNGQVAGWVYVGPNAHAAIYSNGTWRDLGVPAGDELSTLFGINNAGRRRLLLRVTRGRGGQPLAGDPRAGERHVGAALSVISPDSFAYAINDSGAVVGCLNRYDDVYPDPHRAFLYANGSVTDLHALLATNPTDFTCARDVNNAGVVVGEYQSSSAPQRGFVYRNGAATLLAQSSTGAYLTKASAVSNAGKVVGEGQLAGFSATTPWCTTSRPE